MELPRQVSRIPGMFQVEEEKNIAISIHTHIS